MLVLLLLTVFFTSSLSATIPTSVVPFTFYGKRVKPVPGYSPPKYTINLEDSYKVRWSKMMTEKKADINVLVEQAVKRYGTQGAKPVTYEILQQYDQEYALEIKAVAELLEKSVNDVFWLNVMYEAYAYCTSVIVQDKNDFIFHGRNLDYGFTKQIAKIAIDIDYYKNGKVIFRANVLGGFIGFITAEKPGKFSISANQRTTPGIIKSDEHDIEFGRGASWLSMFINRRKSPLILIRKAMETADSYQEAVKFLSTTKTTAPVYYIISGVNKNEGVILTMARDEMVAIDKLDVDKGKWFLVQTNYDRNVTDPSNDNRRVTAEQRMAAIGRNDITMQNMLDGVIGVYPNNNLGTILSCVYASKTDYFNTTMWV